MIEFFKIYNLNHCFFLNFLLNLRFKSVIKTSDDHQSLIGLRERHIINLIWVWSKNIFLKHFFQIIQNIYIF